MLCNIIMLCQSFCDCSQKETWKVSDRGSQQIQSWRSPINTLKAWKVTLTQHQSTSHISKTHGFMNSMVMKQEQLYGFFTWNNPVIFDVSDLDFDFCTTFRAFTSWEHYCQANKVMALSMGSHRKFDIVCFGWKWSNVTLCHNNFF